MRPTGIFASNAKQSLTKTSAYEKGNKLMQAGTSGQENTQIFLQTNKPSNMDKAFKTNILIFQNNLITNN
jgi:hypothetical protein